jgi:thioredoxin-related protein
MGSPCIRAILVVLALGLSVVRAAPTWLADYDAALQQARDEGKLVLINFTGSDWCVGCLQLKTNVFETPEFATFAHSNLVLLEIDFPRSKPFTEAQRVKNLVVQGKYPVAGYPTVILANADGQALHITGNVPGGAPAFIADLKKVPRASWRAADAGASAATAEAAKKTVGSDGPLWNGPVFPPKRYDELKLTGLSGTAARRFAIVNNQTFSPGESARVKLKDGEVKVLCKEIRLRSAIVQVEGAGEPKEIFLEGK